MPKITLRERLTQRRVDYLTAWPGDKIAYYLADEGCPGLLLYKGVRRTSFVFFAQQRRGGKRSTTSVRIGESPFMTLVQARQEARRRMGRIAAGRVDAGKLKATKFDEAFADYVAHLERVGKSDRWAKNVRSLGRLHLLPKFSRMMLSAMSQNPKLVHDFHIDLSRTAGPTSANIAARVIRATYRYASRLDPNLPRALPTAAVEFNEEKTRQVTMPWREWYAVWSKITSRVRKSFAMTQLLIGARPGELSRLKWDDIDRRARAIILRNTKGRTDVAVPLSIEILKALKLARPRTSEYVFPSPRGGHIARFDIDDLPVYGHGLRHVYRTTAEELQINEVFSHMLLGHKLRGVSRGYIGISTLQQSPALRQAQAKISKEMRRRLTR